MHTFCIEKNALHTLALPPHLPDGGLLHALQGKPARGLSHGCKQQFMPWLSLPVSHHTHLGFNQMHGTPFAGPAATAVTRPGATMIPDGQVARPDQEPSLPGQTEVQGGGAHLPAHQVHASPFQDLSQDRRKSWDEPRPDRPVVRDSAGNEQAPGANRQFSLELTTYASIPVRNTKSGFRPPHRSVLLSS